MNNTQNPIAIRSREWLTTALLELMKNKPFQEISVSEIANKADLSRRTFYRCFSSKEEIISRHLETIWRTAALQLSLSKNQSYAQTIQWYLETWYEQKDLALLLYQNNLISLLLQVYNCLFHEVYLLQKGTYPLATQPEAMKYALSYSIGGLLNIFWEWVSEGMQKSPKEVTALLLIAMQLPNETRN